MLQGWAAARFLSRSPCRTKASCGDSCLNSLSKCHITSGSPRRCDSVVLRPVIWYDTLHTTDLSFHYHLSHISLWILSVDPAIFYCSRWVLCLHLTVRDRDLVEVLMYAYVYTYTYMHDFELTLPIHKYFDRVNCIVWYYRCVVPWVGKRFLYLVICNLCTVKHHNMSCSLLELHLSIDWLVIKIYLCSTCARLYGVRSCLRPNPDIPSSFVSPDDWCESPATARVFHPTGELPSTIRQHSYVCFFQWTFYGCISYWG